jgi:hypothetical protein
MKKIFILSYFLIFHNSFSQNSVEVNPTANTGIIYSKGLGTTNWQRVGQVSIYATTGSTTTNNNITAVHGVASNSTYSNQGVVGIASGNSSYGTGVVGLSIGTNSANSIGVFGNSDVINGSGIGVKGNVDMNSIASDDGFGGYFSSNTNNSVNGGARSYGLYAISQGNSTVDYRYGVRSSVSGASTSGAYGMFSTASNSANSLTYAGYFLANGSGTGNKIGIYSKASGSGNLYAAYLEGKVEIGSLGSLHTSIENSSINAWNGTGGQVLLLNNNSGAGVQVRGNLTINDGDIYLDNSTSNLEIVRNKTGLNSDLVPIAYGNVSATGVLQIGASTNNVSVTKTATGTYQITVTDEFFAPALNAYNVFCTIKDTFGFIAPSGNGTNLIITTANTSGTNTDKPFTFIIFKK